METKSFQLESSEMSSSSETSQMETLAPLPCGVREGPIEVMLRLGPPLGTHLLLCRVLSTQYPVGPHLSPHPLWNDIYVYRYSVCCQQSNRAKLRFSLFGCVLGSTRRRTNIQLGIYRIEYTADEFRCTIYVWAFW